MITSEKRRLLGEFVRTHRERMPPEAPTGRRRTPGLRREELAARAGFGATWQAWIEQGREVNASPAALARLAAALELTRAERAYLFELAGRRDPEAPDPGPAADAPVSLRAMIAALECPAYGLDRLWNACCWTPAAEHLFAGWLGCHHGKAGRQRNLLRYVFDDPSARNSAAPSATPAPAPWSSSSAGKAPCSPALGRPRTSPAARAGCAPSSTRSPGRWRSSSIPSAPPTGPTTSWSSSPRSTAGVRTRLHPPPVGPKAPPCSII